ncbi:MAG TPA: ferritin-like domain-containing protein [Chloroflexota bacterium]|nr:ferritin-like domain-containing protein [Chloroflexota bacterium]
MAPTVQQRVGMTTRRSFLGKSIALGAGVVGAGLLVDGLPVLTAEASGSPTEGDIAILRFLAAAEIIESDLWQQYNELGGIQDSEVPGGTGNAAYTNALQQLDGDMPQYVHDNTDDEFSHWFFINAYLKSVGAEPVNLDPFRRLPSSTAPGAQQIKRLTNLMELVIDTSWWEKYRSDSKNPDFGDTFAPAVPGLLKGKFPAIPRHKEDLEGSTATTATNHLQAIANTAGFHFAFIEQGGTSLYPSLAQRVTDPVVLRILLSIGPTEAMHFQTWHDKAGNAPAITDPTNGLTFPNLAGSTDPLLEGNLIMPEPTIFLNPAFPHVSIVRPTNTQMAATSALQALVNDNLFAGQSNDFLEFLSSLATAADNARRGV